MHEHERTGRDTHAGERLIPAVNEALHSAFQFSEWRIDDSLGLLGSFEESRYFCDLLQLVRADADVRKAISPSDIVRWATEQLERIDRDERPENVTFYVFLEITPELAA